MRPNALEFLEVRITPTVKTWSGAIDSIWTRGANWSDGIAPTAGDDLVFPDTATNFTSANDFAAGTSFASISVSSAGYDLTGNAVTLAGPLSIAYSSGSSTIEMDVALGAAGLDVSGGASLDITGALSGTGGVTVSGGSSLTLDGISPNTYGGATTVNAGTLNLAKVGGDAVSGDLVIGDGTDPAAVQLIASDQIGDASSVTVNPAGSLVLNGNSDTIGSLVLTGTSVDTGAATLTLAGDLTTNMSSSQASIVGQLALTAGNHTFNIADPVVGSTPDLVISAAISGPGGIIKAGTGKLALAGSNSYADVTTVSAGILAVSGADALGATSAGTTVANGAVLELDGDVTLAPEPITLDGAGSGGLGALWSALGANSVTGPITLASGSVLRVEPGSRLTISGQITDGSVGFGVTKTGTGTLALSNANPYGGTTDVSEGVLQASNDGAMGTGDVVVEGGAALELSGITPSNSGFTLSGSGINGAGALLSTGGVNTIASPVTLASGVSVGASSGTSLTISSAIGETGGSQGLAKMGQGTVTLSGTSTFTGSTDVLEGTLLVDGNISATAFVDVHNGATLGGSGMVNGLTAESGSTVAPGDSPGILSTTGGAALNSGSTYSVQLNGSTAGTGYDQLSVVGPVDLSSSTLNVTLGYLPAIGDTFTIIDNDGSDAVTGAFQGLPEGSTFNLGIATFQISYAGGDGNDVSLTVTAVTYTWTGLGGDNNWSTAANWDAGVAPAPGSDLVFPSGAARVLNNNDLASGTTFRSITVSGSGYDLNGNDIDLTDGFNVGAAGSVNMNINVAMTAAQAFDVAAGGQLAYYGFISGNFGLTKTGGGALTLSNNYLDNTYTGATTVLDGTLQLNSDHVVIPGNLVVGDGVGQGEIVQYLMSNEVADNATVTLNEGATLDLNGQGDQFRNLVMQGATVNVGGGSISVLTNITVNAAANNVTSTIQGPGSLDLASDDVVFDIADDAELATDFLVTANVVDGGVIKNGAGVLAFSGSNAYDGLTQVNAGTLLVESGSALGTSGPASKTIVAAGASVAFSGLGLIVPEDFDINGAGPSGAGALRVEGVSATLTGSIAMYSDGAIGAADGATLAVIGTIDDVASPFNLQISNGATGRTVLGGDNTNFDGSVNVPSGYLRVANDNALGNPSTSATTMLADGATLELSAGIMIPSTKALVVQLNGVSETMPKVVNVSGDNTYNGPVTFQGNTEINAALGTTLTINGAIGEDSGGRRLISDGDGTLVLAGANSYTGTTFITAGALMVNGSIASSSDVQIYGGYLGGGGTTSSVSVFSGGAIVPGNSPGILSTLDATFNAGSSFNVELDGTTAGSGYDQLNVTGAVQLGGATLNVSLGYTTSLGDSYRIVNNDGSDAINGTFNGLAEGSTFTVGNQQFAISYVGGDGNDVVLTALTRIDTWTGLGGDANWSTGANWQAGVAPVAGDQLVFPSSASRLSSVNDLAAGTEFDSIVIDGAGYDLGGNAIVLDNGISTSYAAGTSMIELDVALANDEAFLVAGGGTLIDSGVISGGHSLIKDGAGTLSLSAANTFTTGAAINGGVLAISNGNALGLGLLTVSGGELDLSGGITVANALKNTYAGTGVRNLDGSNTLSGVVEFFENTTFDVASGSTLSIAGTIGESNPNRSLTKTGGGTLQLGSANSYGGGTDVQAGTLEVLDGQATGTAGLVYVESGATLLQSIGTYNLPSGGLYIGGGTGPANYVIATTQAYTVNGNITLLGPTSFQVGAAGSLDVTGSIGGASSLNLANSSTGMLRLSGTSTYSGSTTIDGGILRVDGDIASSGQIDLNGGILTGDGTVGAVVATGGVVAPGNYLGTLNAGSLGLVSGSTFSVELDGNLAGTGYSQLVTSGPVTLGGSLQENLSGYTPAQGDVLTIIDNQSPVPVSGTFAGLPEGSIISVGGASFQLSYAGGDGNDVTLSFVVATTTQLSSDNPAPVYGDAVTFTATVTAAGATPTGSIWFYDGSIAPENLLSSVTLDALGVAAFTTSTLIVSSSPHSVLAEYHPTGLFGMSASSPLSQAVAPANLTVTADSLSRAYGDANPTLTASFAGFKNGETLATSDVTGAADLSTTATPASPVAGSPYAITASTGTLSSGNYAFQFSDGSLTITQAPTGTAVAASANSTVFGEAQLFTASVSGSGATGTVSFFDGATLLGTAALSSGSASLATSSLSVGPHAITAVYSGDSNFSGSTSPIEAVTVAMSSTNEVVVSSGGSTVVGQPVTFTASVSPASPGAGVPTGTLTFLDGPAVLAVVALDASGGASFSTSGLPIGSHVIQVIYSGDAQFSGGSSAAISQTVGQANTVATLSTSGATVVGQPVTLSATVHAVAPGVGTPTGSVLFLDGTTTLGTANLDSNGQASLVVSGLSAASHGLTIQYLGDVNFAGSTSATVIQNVSPAASAIAIAVPATSVLGRSVTITATVSTITSGAGQPTGSVMFLDGATVIGVAPLSGGMATLTTAALAVNGHSISANYSGDAEFAASHSAASPLNVSQAPSAATIVSTDPAAVYGQSVTFTVQVATDAGSARPTGTITFYDGPTVIGTKALSGGSASLTVANLSVGNHGIAAVYSGDAQFSAITSNLILQQVAAASTNTVFVASANPSSNGQAVTFTAIVSSSDSTAAATGTVSFFDGDALLGSSAVLDDHASFTGALLGANQSHAIRAIYSGDLHFEASQSAVAAQVVTKSDTQAVVSIAPLKGRLSSALTAQIRGEYPAGGIPTGIVVFTIDGRARRHVRLTNGFANTKFLRTDLRGHAVGVRYAGDANNAASVATTIFPGRRVSTASIRH